MGWRILGTALGLGLCMALWIGVSCYSAPEPACGFLCGDNNACPADYTCNTVDRRCHLNGSTDPCFADAGMLDAFDANLTQPVVVSTSPSDGQFDVSRSTSITATFSQDVGPIDSTTFQVFAGEALLPGAYSYDAASFTARFIPATSLPAGTVITPILTSSISNSLHVPITQYSWSFATIDDVAPTLGASTPMDTAVNVPTTTTITVVFSEQVFFVDTSTFTVFHGATQITGTIPTSGDLMTYTFTPTAPLPAASVITVNLAAPIDDTSGNHLVPVSFSFTTM